MSKKSRLKRFSQASPEEVYRAIGIRKLEDLELRYSPRQPSAFFVEKLSRLEHFDLRSTERAKELLIDAFLEEVIVDFDNLKIWKAAPLKDDLFNGSADYLLAAKQDYVSHPLLCVVEAKKDDFEQGRLQCLAEMRACRWNNEQNNVAVDLWGIVTNAETWRFYQWSRNSFPKESLPYLSTSAETVLGILDLCFQQCQQALRP